MCNIEKPIIKDITTDTFFNGRITVAQYISGYRFSIDSVLLANMVRLQDSDRICDIGTGCGIIPIVLGYRHPGVSAIYGIELQERLAQIATCNVNQNQMAHRIKIIHRDATSMNANDTDGLIDLVICNPPHYEKHSSRINPDSEKALARHEIALDIKKLLSTTRRILAPRGRLIVIYPARRITELLSDMRNTGIEPKFLRFVHNSPGKEAMRVIVEGINNGGPGARIAEPLFINDAQGLYTPEIEAMFAG